MKRVFIGFPFKQRGANGRGRLAWLALYTFLTLNGARVVASNDGQTLARIAEGGAAAAPAPAAAPTPTPAPASAPAAPPEAPMDSDSYAYLGTMTSPDNRNFVKNLEKLLDAK